MVKHRLELLIGSKGVFKVNITVVGLGYIGLPVGIKLAESGFDVNGYEIDEKRLDDIKNKTFNSQENELYTRYDEVKDKFFLTNELLESDIYIVTVQTPINKHQKAELTYVKKAFESLAKRIKKDDLIILESTVPPNSNKEFIEYLSKLSNLKEDEFDYAYCPETIQPGNVFKELESNSRVIGTTTEKAFNRAHQIYASITKGKITRTSFLIAEHVKIMQNAYRDYEIAFANALSIYCDEQSMNVFELIELINDHPRAKVLSPGIGVGGHCLPIDPLFILEQNEFEPIRLARKINDQKTNYALKKILDLGVKDVIIFGATYKPNSDDIRHSPSITLAKDLKQCGVNVSFCEPNIKEDYIEGFANIRFQEAIVSKWLIVIAQKHNYFYDNKTRFESKNLLDFVGLLELCCKKSKQALR
ncbi:MAG: nucleotide sugar dehydrogenase [Firmicutes bacterium]|nr:nucleotide sugar dehydrogenase [Bacillota bacterium]